MVGVNQNKDIEVQQVERKRSFAEEDQRAEGEGARDQIRPSQTQRQKPKERQQKPSVEEEVRHMLDHARVEEDACQRVLRSETAPLACLSYLLLA